MFAKIKELVGIVDVHQQYLGTTHPLDMSVSSTTLTTENDDCPWCGHNGCYRIDTERNIATCFSGACSHPAEAADVIEFVRRTLNLDTVREAGIQIIKDFDLPIEYGWSELQRIYNAAAEYYSRCMMTDTKYAELGGMTPEEYQRTIRGHSSSTLDALHIGWADGGLYEELVRQGFDKDIIMTSFLVGGKAGTSKNDLFRNCFVYPHYTLNGRVANFTMKVGKSDPRLHDEKQKKFLNIQIAKDRRPSDLLFFNEDSLQRVISRIAVVEGENDTGSLLDHGWDDAILCTNGSLSRAQIEALVSLGENYEIHTFWDGDTAGKSYMDKMWKAGARSAIPRLFQYEISEEMKDVDNLLQLRKEDGLKELMMTRRVSRPTDEDLGAVVVKEAGSSQIFEARGGYWAIRPGAEAETHVQLTNFVIRLNNVYIRDSQRIRDVVVIHQSGFKSPPAMITSEDKVSIKSFKELAANTVDGFYKGNEQDLINLWEFVYENNSANIVHIPNGIGDLRREIGGWLFRNVMITSSGQVITPDDNGVFWRDEGHGVKPANISAGLMDSIVDINSGSLPSLHLGLSMEEIDNVEHDTIKTIASCVNDPHIALTLIAWTWANVYSTEIFREYGFFPLLQVWGKHGQGKTTLARWILAFFGMGDNDGIHAVSQLRSNVGFERKATFYNGLPLMVDEIRADKMCQDRYSYWRSCYNRTPRTMGTKEGFSIKQVPVNATFGFFGQDTFTDSALRSRCVSIKMPAGERDTQAYDWLNANMHIMSSVTFKWILEAGMVEPKTMFAEMKEIEHHIISLKCDVRMAKIWSVIMYFSRRLQEKYFPEVDFNSYVMSALEEEVEDQQESEMLNEFWEQVGGLQVGENPKVNVEHVAVREDNNTLVIWLRSIYDILSKEGGRALGKEVFSYQAIRRAIKDEAYFIKEDRQRLGRRDVSQRVLIFDIDKLPAVMRPIVEYAKSSY